MERETIRGHAESLATSWPGRLLLYMAAVGLWIGVVLTLHRSRGVSIRLDGFSVPFSLRDPVLDLVLYAAVGSTLAAWWAWAASGPDRRRWDQTEGFDEAEYWDENGDPIDLDRIS